MQRRKFYACLDIFLDIIINKNAILVILSSVYHSVPDCLYFVYILYNTMLRIAQDFHNHIYACCVVRYICYYLIWFTTGGFMSKNAFIQANPFKQSLCEHIAAVRHIEQLVFD